MPTRRISTKPAEVRDQLVQAANGINGEPAWPISGGAPGSIPTKAAVQSQANQLGAAITLVDGLESQLAQARAEVHAKRDAGIETLQRVDQVTDGLYGPDSPKKNNFGLPPRKSSATGVGGTGATKLEQAVIKLVRDGTSPASIFVDWDSQEYAAAYQVEWHSDAAMMQIVGHAAVSESQYEITGLVRGTQYWIRVRAIRGAEFGTWSDPATRVANL